nr:CatB-related O-acetyltransferase [uncultured Flavobacterium sp.]
MAILIKKIKLHLYKLKLSWQRKAFIKKIRNKKNVRIHPSSTGYTKVIFEGDNGIPENCQFLGNNISIGYRTTLGKNNLLGGNVTIGKYCQIGADVAMHASDHPISYMTTYINKNLFNGELNKHKIDNSIIVGNDVWVGHSVIIVGNVTVGNGAILAAGAVVTKDVPPYAIVAGVPAKVLKYRFSDTIINEIQDLKWWDMSDTELQQNRALFNIDFKDKNSIFD